MEMFELVGHGIAMGNAVDRLKTLQNLLLIMLIVRVLTKHFINILERIYHNGISTS